MVSTHDLRHILSNKTSIQNSSSVNKKTSIINIASPMADASAEHSASPLGCARAFCLRDSKQSSLQAGLFPASRCLNRPARSPVPSCMGTTRTILAYWRASRCSRDHEAFVGCFVSFAQAFVSTCQVLQAANGPQQSQHSCMSNSTSLSSVRKTHPTTLGVGAALRFVSLMLCNHCTSLSLTLGVCLDLLQCPGDGGPFVTF